MAKATKQNSAEQQSPAKTPIILSLEALTATKDEIEDYLSGEENGHLKLTVTSGLDRLINRLAFLSGSDVATSAPIQFKPVTDFMGEEITQHELVTDEELDPTEAEKQQYLAKVDKLYAEIDTLDANGILNSYGDAEGEQVLRGVAKRAGVEGYEDRELTIPFVEGIVSGKKAKENDAKEQAEIERQLALQAKQ